MIYAIVTVLVLIADQVVKFWTTKNIILDAVNDACVKLIPGVLHMTNVHNTGAAFGILQDSRWPLVIVSALFVLVIIILINSEVIHTRFGKWIVVLVMAGAISNCIDRVLYGYVVDMFEFEFMNFPVFNVADIFITVCGILFCLHVLFHNEPEAVKEANAPEFIRKRRQELREQEEQEQWEQEQRKLASARRQTAEEQQTQTASSRRSEQLLDEWDFGDEFEAPAPRQQTASRQAGDKIPPVRPAPKQELPVSPDSDPVYSEDEPEDSSFTLEDILAEFGDL